MADDKLNLTCFKYGAKMVTHPTVAVNFLRVTCEKYFTKECGVDGFYCVDTATFKEKASCRRSTKRSYT